MQMRRGARIVAGVLAAAAFAVPATAGAQVQPRVVGGSTAPAGVSPWQAAVRDAAGRAGGSACARQFCGGVRVAPRIVLTAAHCVYDTDPDFIGGQPAADDVD